MLLSRRTWGWFAVATLIVVVVARGPVRGEDAAPGPPLAPEAIAAFDEAWRTVAQAAEVRRTGDTARADTLIREALAPLEKRTDLDHADSVGRMSSLAGALYQQGVVEPALRLFERAIAIAERTIGRDSQDVAVLLNNLGAVQYARGEFAAAGACLDRAIAIHDKSDATDRSDLAGALATRGAIAHAQGDLDAARAFYERALALFQAAPAPDVPRVAVCVNGLAWVLRDHGDYEAALAQFQRSLALVEGAMGPEHPRVGVALHNLSGLYRTMGALDAARPLQERALAIHEKSLGPDHPTTVASLSALALVLEEQGSLDAARPLFERALASDERHRGPDDLDTARSLNNLALLLELDGDLARARALHERSLQITEKRFGAGHSRVAMSLENLGTVLLALGDLDAAQARLDRALRIYESVLGTDHPHLARCQGKLAAVRAASGDLDAARTLWTKAVEGEERTLGPDATHVVTGLARLALLEQSQRRPDRARQLLADALARTERRLRRMVVAVEASERFDLVRTSRWVLDHWLSVVGAAAPAGYPEVIRFKGLLTRIEAAERRLLREGDAARDPRVAAMTSARRRLARLASAVPPRQDAAQRRQWQERYAQAAAEWERLSQALAKDLAPLRAGLDRLDLGPGRVQAALSPDAALVDILRAGGHYLAWVVRRDGAPVRVDLGDAAEIDTAAEAYTPGAGAAEEQREAAERLRQRLIVPLLPHLPETVRTLYVCPDAGIAAVPFGALGGRRPDAPLAADACVVHVGMAQDLVPDPAPAAPGRAALLLGGVDYEQARALEASTEPRPDVPPSALPRPVASTRAPAGRTFAPIPETGREVTGLAPLLGANATTVTGADATEARLRRLAPGRRTLHLATHGFVRTDLSSALRPVRGDEDRWLGAALERHLTGFDPRVLAGLALAGANRGDGADGDDGILTALEVADLDLRGTGVVVLSACETALGKAESGEGVLGLVQAFQMAGARSVIASLWAVDDEATRLLMGRLYEGMLRPKDPLPPAVALREASLWLRTKSSPDGRSFADPRFWAAFVCYERR